MKLTKYCRKRKEDEHDTCTEDTLQSGETNMASWIVEKVEQTNTISSLHLQ